MYSVCVFAGTTEGRRLVEFMRGQDVRVLACVATWYGETLTPKGDNIEVAAGRLDADAMAELLEKRRFDLVIDATHPYAEAATGNIEAACAATGTEYLRLNRDGATSGGETIEVNSIQAAADFLASHPGNALITTGSKELSPYAGVPGFRERLYARVLPTQAALAAVERAGFGLAHAIAMQGPFSTEMNAAMLRAVRAEWLVTKDSGENGGLPQKIEAARAAGARCVVVGRPKQVDGLSYAQTVALLIERFGLRDVREIDIVGVGMGTPESITLEARRALDGCDCIIGAKRFVDRAALYGKPGYAEYAPRRIAQVIDEHPEHRHVAVVVSGDAGFFSGAKKLLPLLTAHRVRVLPGVSTMQCLCAKLQTSWDDVHAISLHGRDASVVPDVRRCGKVFALLGDAEGLSRVCGQLIAAGMGDARIAVGERLTYPDERIFRGTAQELRGERVDPLSALLIERAPENPPLPVGLPDEAFLRDAGEKCVPMTKSEVRAVTLSKLRLTEDAVVWDVGAGTGSVSVEAALLCRKGYVWAVERREDAAALIEQNAAKFGLDNLRVVVGEAPAALADLPAPTHVFIGGSGGRLRQIVEAALEKSPRARIVVNAVAPETVGEIARVMREMDFNEHELVQLSVARSRSAGSVHLMDGMNPVWIATMRRGEGESADEG